MKIPYTYYSLCKWIALILLPALAVLTQGLADLYAWPDPLGKQVVGSLNLLAVFLGALLQGWHYRRKRGRAVKPQADKEEGK